MFILGGHKKKKQMEYKKKMENKVSTIQLENEQLKNNEVSLKNRIDDLSRSYDMLKIECE